MSIRKVALRVALAGIALAIVLGSLAIGAYYLMFYVPGQERRTIVSQGEEREYLVHVPAGYDPARPTPLVISLHAAMLWPATQMRTSHWNRVADENGFIVVYPAGRRLGGGGTGVWPRAWFMSAHAVEMPDVRFISDLIDTLASRYNVDPTRIYANGFSNGGGMAFALSCTLSQRLAAIGAVAAAQALPWSWCKDDRPVPMIAFHGTADRVVPYEGAPPSWLAPRPFPNVSAWAASWARRNRCAPGSIETAVTADVKRLQYTACADSAAVVLYTIRGGGHSWPGGRPMPRWLVGPTTQSIDATRLMWEFFREHRRRQGSLRPGIAEAP